jgi:hypothetical protein
LLSPFGAELLFALDAGHLHGLKCRRQRQLDETLSNLRNGKAKFLGRRTDTCQERQLQPVHAAGDGQAEALLWSGLRHGKHGATVQKYIFAQVHAAQG